MPEEREKKDGEEGKPSPFKIRPADFSNPRPFESRPGVFHPYTYLPFIGWLPQTEFMILIAFLGIVGACTVPAVVRGVHKRAEAANRRSLADLRQALGRYESDHKRLPGRLEDVAAAGMPPLDLRPRHGKSISSSVGTDADDAGDWRYAPPAASAGTGAVFINCTHTDSRGSAWSSY